MNNNIFDELRRSISEYDDRLAVQCAKQIVDQGMDVTTALEVMTDAVRQIGEGYAIGRYFIPDLIGASEAMSSALPFLEEEIKRRGSKTDPRGTVVIGTVYGDLHTIGKSMVSTMLVAEGFRVYDLGINVRSEKFIEGVRRYNADILAMCSLLTMTAPEQKKTIDLLKSEGLRSGLKVMVGGGAITQEFADSIGADGYDPTAPGAAKLARKLVNK